MTLFIFHNGLSLAIYSLYIINVLSTANQMIFSISVSQFIFLASCFQELSFISTTIDLKFVMLYLKQHFRFLD